MAAQKKQHKDMASWKPGSESAEAKDVGGKGDFGVPADVDRTGQTTDRDYTSANTKASDPGAQHPMDWEHDGKRDHGAGVPDSGPGSGSAGDLDTDIIGVGTGGGVSISGPDDRRGPDDVDENARPSDALAGGGHARGDNQTGVGQVGGAKRVRGSVVQTGDRASDTVGQGADAAVNPIAHDDDSFVGEISSGEAQGQDLGISPSSDTQGLGEAAGQDEKDARGDD